MATQCLHAVGCAEAGLIYDRVTTIPNREARYHSDQLTYVSIGEGGTSEGEFWESLNTACTRKLPVLYLVEDNGYAISVPVEAQTPGGDISRLVESFPDLSVHRCDGTDYLESYDTLEEAIAYVRARRGPALVHAKVMRPYSHSLSDDEKLYKTPAEREEEATRDPLVKMRAFLIAEGLATEEELADLVTSVEREVARAADQALEAPKPDPRTATSFVFSPVVDPTSSLFVSEPRPEGNPDTMLAAINKTLRDEMARDARIVIFGQDVADATRAEALSHRGRQGRRVQGHARPAARVRQRPRVQLAAGRGQHRRARSGHGAARAEAGRRDPVLRLHLARLHADSRRAVDDAVPVGQQLVVPGRDPRADRRVPQGRRAVSQPVGARDLRADTGPARDRPLERPGRGGAAAHGDPLRRPGALLRAQAPVPPDLQQGALPGRRLHGAVRQGVGRARRP